MRDEAVVVYTDGACAGNPGPGGWAAIVLDGEGVRELSGADPRTTNQRMELRAALEGLAAIAGRRRVRLHSDSLYLVNGFRRRWWVRWEQTGWLGSAGRPVANRDLWEALLAQDRRHQVEWAWVRGHAGDPLNERADALARAALGRARPASPSPGGILDEAPEKAGRSPAAAMRREESPGSAGQGAG